MSGLMNEIVASTAGRGCEEPGIQPEWFRLRSEIDDLRATREGLWRRKILLLTKLRSEKQCPYAVESALNTRSVEVFPEAV
jgi:hypothetical protein